MISTNFDKPFSSLEPGMILRAGHSFELNYLVSFTKPGVHDLGVRFDTAPPYWYGEWYVEIDVR